MSIRPDSRLYICLLLFYTFMFACVHGKDEDVLPACDVALMVPQGSTTRASPHQSLTVSCPVQNCRESVSVAWCKQLDRCKPVFPSENVEMSQSEKGDGKLMAYLIFKRISVEDAGLYRCYVDGYRTEQISHIINISVSDVLPTCDVALMVPQGSTRRVAPYQSLTVRCPVLTCGESVSVAWCKQLDRCKPVFPTEDVEIRQSEKGDGKLMAYLIFERISVEDAGLYRCYVDGYRTEQISHIINISVSALNQEIENLDDDYSGDIHHPADDADVSWLPFFFVCLGIVLSVGVVIMLPLFRRYCQKRNQTFNQTNTQGKSQEKTFRAGETRNNEMEATAAQSDFHSRNATGMLTSRLNVMTEANQPANAVPYARINHGQSQLMAYH